MARRAALAAAVLALAVLGWLLAAPAPHRSGAASARGVPHASPAMPARRAADGRPASTGMTPAPVDPERVLHQGSLRGTAVDGDVTVGFAGRIAPDLGLRRLFDYYLSLLGETGLDGIEQLLREDLRQRRLDAGQQAEVMALFARYVDYQQARAALAAAGTGDLADRLAQDRALRERLLGPALSQAFYPTADADAARLLRQLAHDDPATASTRADPATVAVAVQTQTDALDAASVTPAQRHAARAAAWGEAAAGRLDALDRQRAQWAQRLADFARAADVVQRDPALDEDQRRAMLGQLLDQRFQGPERLQAQAMWQAGLLPPAR